MIINDTNHFAFIHIPKCAGMSVRRALQSFDERNGAYTCRTERHPRVGWLDYAHIPLLTLLEYFPEEFVMLREYWSFSVVRDPYARFASSVSQRLRMYSAHPIERRSAAEIRRVVDESIGYLSSLSKHMNPLPPEFIHFQKQVDYVYLHGERITDSLYTIDDLAALFSDVGRHVGQTLHEPEGSASLGKANESLVFRNEALRRVFVTSWPVTHRFGRLFPEGAKRKIRNKVYVPRDRRMGDVFKSQEVSAFISEYYRDDILLYRQVLQEGHSNAV